MTERRSSGPTRRGPSKPQDEADATTATGGRRLTEGRLLVLLAAPPLPVLRLKVFHQEYLIQARYLYPPSIGFCLLVALLVEGAARRRQTLAYACAAVVIVAFGVSTVSQNRVWDDGVALWSRAALDGLRRQEH